jgi:rare lipoprotein A
MPCSAPLPPAHSRADASLAPRASPGDRRPWVPTAAVALRSWGGAGSAGADSSALYHSPTRCGPSNRCARPATAFRARLGLACCGGNPRATLAGDIPWANRSIRFARKPLSKRRGAGDVSKARPTISSTASSISTPHRHGNNAAETTPERAGTGPAGFRTNRTPLRSFDAARRQTTKTGNHMKILMQRWLLLILMLITSPTYAAEVRAAWYGNELRGHRTASGEMFNPNGMTAAHRSLPFGTCLVVGNPKTGQTVVVRVNDRGPFTGGLTLDLSSGAARAIGMRSTQSVTMKRC